MPLAYPVNTQFPDVSAATVPLAASLKVTRALFPTAEGLIDLAERLELPAEPFAHAEGGTQGFLLRRRKNTRSNESLKSLQLTYFKSYRSANFTDMLVASGRAGGIGAKGQSISNEFLVESNEMPRCCMESLSQF